MTGGRSSACGSKHLDNYLLTCGSVCEISLISGASHTRIDVRLEYLSSYFWLTVQRIFWWHDKCCFYFNSDLEVASLGESKRVMRAARHCDRRRCGTTLVPTPSPGVPCFPQEIRSCPINCTFPHASTCSHNTNPISMPRGISQVTKIRWSRQYVLLRVIERRIISE